MPGCGLLHASSEAVYMSHGRSYVLAMTNTKKSTAPTTGCKFADTDNGPCGGQSNGITCQNHIALTKGAPARKAAAPEPKPVREPKEIPAIIHETTARKTGFKVQVINLEHPDSPRKKPKGDDNKFATRCVRHNTIVTSKTRREAHQQASKSIAWCAKCEPRA